MRKYLILGLTAILTLSVASFASARTDIQTVKVKVTPSNLDKKKFNNAKIFVDIDTKPDDELSPGLDQPPAAVRTRVDFSNNMRFDPKAVKTCKVTADAIQNQTAKAATKLCGKKSKVSLDTGTDATLQFDPAPTTPGTSPTLLKVKVTAFNGNEKNTLYLHTDPQGIPTKPVLIGKLKKGPKGYGKTLDVTVPGTPPFTISEFRTTVKAGSYVQARCKDKNATYQARTDYSDHPSTKATSIVKCKQKSSKGGKKGGKK